MVFQWNQLWKSLEHTMIELKFHSKVHQQKYYVQIKGINVAGEGRMQTVGSNLAEKRFQPNIRKDRWIVRVIGQWNGLPRKRVDFPLVEVLKHRLEPHQSEILEFQIPALTQVQHVDPKMGSLAAKFRCILLTAHRIAECI